MFEHYSKLRGLSETVAALAPVALYSPWVNTLWATIENAVSEMISQIERLPGEVQDAQELAEAFADQEDILLPLLGLIEAGEAVRVPYTMIEPLRQIASAELHECVSLALSCQWVPSNYAVRPTVADELRGVLELIYQSRDTEAVRSVPRTLAVVSVPAGQTESVLEHAALFHEIAHIVTYQEKYFSCCAEYVTPTEDDVTHLTDVEAQARGHLAGERALPWDRVRADVQERLFTAAASWLWECLSDVWAVFKAGPAPLLALWELRGVEPPSDTHPPTWTRYGLMRRCLEHAGFCAGEAQFEWLSQVLGKMEQQIADHKEEVYTPEEREPVYDYLIKKLEDATDDIVSHFYTEPEGYLAEHWTASSVDDAKTGQRAHPFVVCLLNYVPPHLRAQERVPEKAILASVLNAGWNVLCAHEYWSRFCNGLGLSDLSGDYEARKRLNKLLLKGMEVSHLGKSGGQLE